MNEMKETAVCASSVVCFCPACRQESRVFSALSKFFIMVRKRKFPTNYAVPQYPLSSEDNSGDDDIPDAYADHNEAPEQHDIRQEDLDVVAGSGDQAVAGHHEARGEHGVNMDEGIREVDDDDHSIGEHPDVDDRGGDPIIDFSDGKLKFHFLFTI